MAVINLFPYSLRWRESISHEDEDGDPIEDGYTYSEPVKCDAKQNGGSYESLPDGKRITYTFEIELPPHFNRKIEDGDVVELTLLDGEVFEKPILSHKRYQLQTKIFI